MPGIRTTLLASLALFFAGCSFNSQSSTQNVECVAGEPGCRPGDEESLCPTADVQCSIVCAGHAFNVPDECDVAACDCQTPPPASCDSDADCGTDGRCERVCPVCVDPPCAASPCDNICVPDSCQNNADCGDGLRCDKSCTERRFCPPGLSCARSCVGECVAQGNQCGDQTCGADSYCATICPNCFGGPCPFVPCRLECLPDSGPDTPDNCPSAAAYCVASPPELPAGCPVPDCGN